MPMIHLQISKSVYSSIQIQMLSPILGSRVIAALGLKTHSRLSGGAFGASWAPDNIGSGEKAMLLPPAAPALPVGGLNEIAFLVFFLKKHFP